MVDSTRKNSFVSCCTIFSKTLHVIQPTQTCLITMPNNDFKDFIIFYDIPIKINVFVPLPKSSSDDFYKFMISSYCFSKKNKFDNVTETKNFTLNEIMLKNFIEWEKDYYTTLLGNKDKSISNIIVDMEIIEDVEEVNEVKGVKQTKYKGFVASLSFKDYFIAYYFYNRFTNKNNPTIKIQNKEYHIQVIPLNKSYSQVKKTTIILPVKSYLLSQLSTKIGTSFNQMNKISLNSEIYYNREKIKEPFNPYYVLFHPNIILNYNYRDLFFDFNLFAYDDFFAKLINEFDYNHNIHWFCINSNYGEGINIKCFDSKFTTNQKIMIVEKNPIQPIVKKPIKEPIIKKEIKLPKNQTIINSFLTATPVNIDILFEKSSHCKDGLKRKRNNENDNKPSKIQKITSYFVTNNK